MLVTAALMVSILVKLFIIQFAEGPELRAKAERATVQFREIPAARGNIYASNGALLATTMPQYSVHMDVATVSETLFDENVSALAKGLSNVLGGRSASQFESYIRSNRGHRYLRIDKDISYRQLLLLKELPIFNRGKFKGGLIIEQKNKRQMPLGKIAERTIGYHRNGIQVGLEGSYSPDLAGHNGKALSQKIARGEWKPLHDRSNAEPIDGFDLMTTLDVSMQDIAHTALLRALEKHEADHGCVILMEVKTGAIKAIVNLGVTDHGKYYEKYNYAIGESGEPGSTFKLPALVAGLEDGRLDTGMRVDTKNGLYKFYQYKMADSRRGGYGEISLGRAFVVSSNIGLARSINEAYADEPERFINRLYKMNLMEPSGIGLLGEPDPVLPNPEHNSWSGISLPWMATGYGVQLTPLQCLNYYNAIANNGKLMRPFLVAELQREGKAMQTVEPKVLNPAICSQEVLLQVKDLLRKVVLEGTATNLNTSKVSISGKTGTCVLNYWKTGEEKEYQASFAGYFPSEKPQYSCIVVVQKPKKSTGYYGSDVAAPVFKEIALNTMSMLSKQLEDLEVQPRSRGLAMANATELNKLAKGLGLPMQTEVQPSTDLFVSTYSDSTVEVKPYLAQEKGLPNLKGLSLMDALYLLENLGIEVDVRGSGKVKKQSVRAGTPINQINRLTIYLEV